MDEISDEAFSGGIPLADVLRLFRSVVIDGAADDGKKQLERWMTNGFSFNPDLDLQDIATLTRILAGEKWGV